jgi:hypothetical protein
MPTTRKVVGLWLCVFAIIGFFMLPLAREHIFIFMLHCNEQAMMSTFLHHIAREQTMTTIF